MILEHAILGFLNYRPMTGYQLKKIFDTSVRHFWPADQAQIYRALGRLAVEGWAAVEVIEQHDRPDRKEYTITDEGKQELRSWLLTPLHAPESRSAPMVQVFFAGQLSDDEVCAMLERTASQIRAVLGIYEQIPMTMEVYSDIMQSPREFYFWKLTLDIGLDTMRFNLNYIENLIQRIKNGELPEK